MSNPPHIPGLPSGWKVLHFHRSARHVRDALVLCESEHKPDDIPTFVVWSVNMVEGGCHNGYYRMDYDAAKKWYAEHIERMN